MHFNHIPSIPQLFQIPLYFSTYLIHFSQPTVSDLYSLWPLGCEVTHWTIANLLGFLPLHKSGPPFPSIYYILIPHLRVGLLPTSPHAEILWGLRLHNSRCYNPVSSQSAVLPSPKDALIAIHPSCSHSLSTSPIPQLSLSLGRRGCDTDIPFQAERSVASDYLHFEQLWVPNT